jgi:hypothetical protein
MKTPATALLLFLLATNLAVRADNWITNGDFSNGMDSWRGDARTPADLAPSDPFAKPDPFLSQGLIIQLKDRDWAKVQQDFRTKSSTLYLTITYKVSPDLALSTNQEDYTNVPAHIGYNAYVPFNIAPGNWLIFLANFEGNNGLNGIYNYGKPRSGTSDPQTIHLKFSGLTPFERKILCLAFPPGSGTVVLLNVSMTDQPDESDQTPAPPAQ